MFSHSACRENGYSRSIRDPFLPGFLAILLEKGSAELLIPLRDKPSIC